MMTEPKGNGIISALLCCFILSILSSRASALDCSRQDVIAGPCVECELAWPTVRESLRSPSFYWDVCHGIQREHSVLHYFPQRIAVKVKDGRPMSGLRQLSSGQVILDAVVIFYPEAAPDRNTDLSDIVATIRSRHPNARFLSPLPDSVEHVILGRMANWVESVRFDVPSFLDVTQSMKLRVTFKAEYAAQVKESLKRPAGIVMRVAVKYRGFTRQGQSIPFDYVIPLVVGSVNVSR